LDKNNFNEINLRFVAFLKKFAKGDDFYTQNINLKIVHTYKTLAHCKNIAESINLNESSVLIASTIGLLHDIGRFPQFEKYRTYDDRASEDHAVLGIKTIEDEAILKGIDKESASLICDAISYHNSFHLPQNIDEKTKLFSNIIRDADKLDIFRVLSGYYSSIDDKSRSVIEFGLPETDSYSLDYIDNVFNYKSCDYRFAKSVNDLRIMRMSWVLNLSFAYSFNVVSESDFVSISKKMLPDTPEILKLAVFVEEFVRERGKLTAKTI